MIPAVVLAAGTSTRMGQPKALLRCGPSDTFLSRIVRTLQEADVDDIVIVLGHEASAIRDSVINKGLLPRFVINREYESGQLSSIQAGLAAVDRPGVHAMLMTLVDVPLVSSETVRCVIDRYRSTHAPVVRPVRGALHGHPVLVDRSLFHLLRAADPKLGAKPVVRAHVSSAGDLTVDDDGAFQDIDTPEEYTRLFGFAPTTR